MSTSRSGTIRFQRPYLYPKQLAAIYAPERYAVIEASTKSGKTHGCIIWFFEHAFLHGFVGYNGWWVAPVYGQAEIAYRRMCRYLPKDAYYKNDGRLTITLLCNGATMWFKSAERPDSLYGEDVYCAVMDESTRMRAESWYAVRSTLTATRGPVRIIGNVKGRKNWAYQLGQEAKHGAKDMHYAKITAYDAVNAGVLAADEIEDARRRYPVHVFNELYLAEPGEDGGNPFGVTTLDKQCREALAPGPTVVWGVDLARKKDYSVLIGLNRDGHQSALHRFQKPWNETVKRIVDVIGRTPAVVDATGVGDAAVDWMRQTKLPDPAITTSMRYGLKDMPAMKKRPNIYDFIFTQRSKQDIMEGLSLALQEGHTAFYRGPNDVMLDELLSFEYIPTRTGVIYSAPDGFHDDCVCAYALAWHGYKHKAALSVNMPKPEDYESVRK